MSKIGQKPIIIPETAQVAIDKKTVSVSGGKGKLSIVLPQAIEGKIENKNLILSRIDDSKKSKSLHGLFRQLVSNAVIGVEKPWQNRLEVVGTGYNVKLQGEDLIFRLGYSHPLTFKKVEGVSFQVEGNNKVVVLGCDKQLVGQVASQIKLLKKPDVYKGKGIRFEGEKLRIKPGKKVKAVGEPT